MTNIGKKIFFLLTHAGGVINYYSCSVFNDLQLWTDMDHLNSKGAEVFTKKLYEDMKELNLL